MKIAKRYLTLATVILFTISFFYYLYEYNLYGKKITNGNNNYYEPKKMTKKQSLNEIIQKADITEKKQCNKYKTDIKEYCLNLYYRYTKSYYDLTIDPEDMETYLISKQLCCSLKQIYIPCMFAYLNIICEPDEIETVFETIQTQIDICSKYFDIGDKCYLIANYIKEDSTEKDDDEDTDTDTDTD